MAATKKRKHPAAVALGRRGGKVTSDAKAASARANGAKGGRPKKDTTRRLPMLALLALSLLLAGCASMSDVQPGDGKAITVTGKTYEQVYAAAAKVTDAHFDIHDQSPATGIIKAERTVSMFGNGAWIGVYITPAQPGADHYRVEVVSRKKATGNIGEQNWERKTLRDIQDVLDGRPMR